MTNVSKPEEQVINNRRKVKKETFPMVGIGASAGGLEALEEFFSNMPGTTGLSFVVVQHLDPDHESVLHELLQRNTPMKVLQARDRMKVEPNTVYTIPPNKSLSILRGYLHLFEAVKTRGLRLPIDILFRSMAADLNDNCVGIIFSGMGSDGSNGLRSIKEKNGLVLVQDPRSAKFNSMPLHALDATLADVVASADQLPSRLLSLLKYNPPNKKLSLHERKNISDVEKIMILIREKTAHDFSGYKKASLLRRIERRKSALEIETLKEYIRYLQQNPQEIEILFKELLIGVTNFFRDPQVWDYLRNTALPKLIETLPDGYLIRAWVTSCSTGEEAYSLAMVFNEALEESKTEKTIRMQIFATDLDEDSIEKARKGVFTRNIMTDVTDERLHKYFVSEGDYFQVNTQVREMIIFASQNIIQDPPFTKIDILTCRNMLIYMESDLQKKLVKMFNFALKPGGLLVLGNVEAISDEQSGFEVVDGNLKIFRRTLAPSAHRLSDFPRSSRFRQSDFSENPPAAIVTESIQKVVDQLILQRYAPSGVLVNGKGDIVYISGRTGRFLEPVAGRANWNIYAMVREGLQNEVHGLIRKAIQNFEPVFLHGIKVKNEGKDIYVDVIVQQLDNPQSLRGYLLVLFSVVTQPGFTQGSAGGKGKMITHNSLQKLEMELTRSQQEIQEMREEKLASQEELKSTKEKLQYTNEEFQTTNEELTTSKEELQSLNEELHSVNAELQRKVTEFIKTNDDMKNLLNSTQIATLFLDKQLNIRRYTSSATKIFKLRKTDVGRPFTDLANNLDYKQLEQHIHQVLKTLTTIETDIATTSGKWYNIRIMPYRTADDRINGLVITFMDISDAKSLEIELKRLNEELKKN